MSDLPSWEDTSLGTMKRVALWLVTVVGEGEVFTKEELRQAFPGVSQVDRRMRDLRDFGWSISTNREDGSLDPVEQRFVEPGIPVWEPGKATRPAARSPSGPAGGVRSSPAMATCAARAASLRAPSTRGPTSKRNSTSHAAWVRRADGAEEPELVTECQRCRLGARELVADLTKVLSAVNALPVAERRALAGWVEADERVFNAAERIWGEYRSLPEESRAAVRAALGL